MVVRYVWYDSTRLEQASYSKGYGIVCTLYICTFYIQRSVCHKPMSVCHLPKGRFPWVYDR